MVTDACAQNKSWRADVATFALAAREGVGLSFFVGPLVVEFEFIFPRPKGHFGAKGIKKTAPQEHTKKPDTTKLVRAAEDALTGVIWKDDAQIVRQIAWKRYADDNEPPGCRITIWEVLCPTTD